MIKIIASILVSAIGWSMVFGSRNTNTSGLSVLDNSSMPMLIMGMIIQIAAVYLFMSGCKSYFLSEILTELKTMNTRSAPSIGDPFKSAISSTEHLIKKP